MATVRNFNFPLVDFLDRNSFLMMLRMPFELVHSVWKLLKMSHLNLGNLAISTNFCPIKIDLSGITVWPHATFPEIFKHCVVERKFQKKSLQRDPLEEVAVQKLCKKLLHRLSETLKVSWIIQTKPKTPWSMDRI